MALHLAAVPLIDRSQSILNIDEHENDTGVKEWRLGRFAVARGPRNIVNTGVNDVLATEYSLPSMYSDAVGPPKLLIMSITARAKGVDHKPRSTTASSATSIGKTSNTSGVTRITTDLS